MPTRIRNSFALAALATSLLAMPALGQPAPPSTPVAQAAAWSIPHVAPVTPVAQPGLTALGPAQAEGSVLAREQTEQAAFASNYLASQWIAQQVIAEQALQQAAAGEAAQTAATADSLEQTEPSAVEAGPADEAPPTGGRTLTLAAPSALDARGANTGAELSWQLPEGGRAQRYRIYCDDGSLAQASSARTVLASDECPSQVALVAGDRPEVGFRACGEVDGAASGASLNGLENGEPVAFALAAVDDTGAVGPLSNVSCAIPSQSGEYELDDPTAATATSLDSVEGGCATASHAPGSWAPAAFLAGAALLGSVLRRRSAVRIRLG